MGGIPTSTTEHDLVRYFGAFGTVTAVHIPLFKKKKTSKGFAFVQYSTDHEKNSAIDMPIQNIDGKDIVVRACVDPDVAQQTTKSQLSLKLYVRNLSPETTEIELRAFFTKHMGPNIFTNLQLRYNSSDGTFKNSASIFPKDYLAREKLLWMSEKLFFHGKFLKIEPNETIKDLKKKQTFSAAKNF